MADNSTNSTSTANAESSINSPNDFLNREPSIDDTFSSANVKDEIADTQKPEPKDFDIDSLIAKFSGREESPEQSMKSHDVQENDLRERISNRQSQSFDKNMSDLRMAMDEEKNSMADFQKRSRELGADLIAKDKSLTNEQKEAEYQRLYDQHPDFLEKKNKAERDQSNLARTFNNTKDLVKNAQEREGNHPSPETRKHMEELDDFIKSNKDHFNLHKDSPLSQISNTMEGLSEAIHAISQKITKAIEYIFGGPQARGMENEAGQVAQAAQEHVQRPSVTPDMSH